MTAGRAGGPHRWRSGSRSRTESWAVELVDEFVSLAGTIVNCAGGPTPWGSWLSCEETLRGTESGFDRPHGYVFEVPADATGPVDPVPLRAMGRFVHEAVAVDPATGIVYQTEDRDDNEAGFYRFIPDTPEVLADGGRLQMMAVTDQPRYVHQPWPEAGRRVARALGRHCRSGSGGLALRASRRARRDSSGLKAPFPGTAGNLFRLHERRRRARGAGPPLPAHLGRGWRAETGLRVVLARHPGQPPDNIVLSPHGGLLLCEDGGGDQYIRELDRGGTDREPCAGWTSRVRGFVLQPGRPAAVLQRAGRPDTRWNHGERHLCALETAGRHEPKPPDLTHWFPARQAGEGDTKRALKSARAIRLHKARTRRSDRFRRDGRTGAMRRPGGQHRDDGRPERHQVLTAPRASILPGIRLRRV